MNLTLDANALIALLQGEPGGELVQELVDDPANIAYVHAANLCEVYYDFHRTEGKPRALEVLETVLAMDLAIREDMDTAFVTRIGDYKATISPLSFADCFCAALADRLGATIITADREFNSVQQRGICPVRFIR